MAFEAIVQDKNKLIATIQIVCLSREELHKHEVPSWVPESLPGYRKVITEQEFHATGMKGARSKMLGTEPHEPCTNSVAVYGAAAIEYIEYPP